MQPIPIIMQSTYSMWHSTLTTMVLDYPYLLIYLVQVGVDGVQAHFQ